MNRAQRKKKSRLDELRRKADELADGISRYQEIINGPATSYDELRRVTRLRVDLEDKKDRVDEEISQLEESLEG